MAVFLRVASGSRLSPRGDYRRAVLAPPCLVAGHQGRTRPHGARAARSVSSGRRASLRRALPKVDVLFPFFPIAGNLKQRGNQRKENPRTTPAPSPSSSRQVVVSYHRSLRFTLTNCQLPAAGGNGGQRQRKKTALRRNAAGSQQVHELFFRTPLHTTTRESICILRRRDFDMSFP